MVDELDACMIWMYMHENLMNDDFWCVCVYIYIHGESILRIC
jgi:hypothetical protein